MSDTAQDKVNQIAAIIEAWRQNDSPEGEMSAGWVLGQIREVLGPSDSQREGETEEMLRQRRIKRDTSTPEKAASWASAERTAREVSTWPDHKRAGINVAELREEPRSMPETSIPEKPESSPPPAEMAVVLGTGDDAGPASEELDGG